MMDQTMTLSQCTTTAETTALLLALITLLQRKSTALLIAAFTLPTAAVSLLTIIR